jgi:hypothetical protein
MQHFLQPNPEHYCERRVSKFGRALGFRTQREIRKVGKGCEACSVSTSLAS